MPPLEREKTKPERREEGLGISPALREKVFSDMRRVFEIWQQALAIVLKNMTKNYQRDGHLKWYSNV